ncbi:MAG: hypothetical protein IJG97_01055 [Bacilli bacterium]|nr:hypothetical protein [Bacilli bacterium]
MNYKTKIVITSLIVAFDVVLLCSIVILRNATMENNLRKEVDELVKLDFTKDRYNTPVKNSGRYGKAEATIKNYLDDYAVLLQTIVKDVNDEKLTKILSYDNYQKDGPEFKESLEYITSAKKEFNKNIDKLIANSEKKSIIDYGNDNINNARSLELYKELMLSDAMLNDLKKTQKTLIKTKSKINNIYDTSNNVLNLLAKNKDNWKLEKGEIKFKNQALYNEYNNMIKKVK